MSDSWRTPDWLYKALDLEFKFDLDPCPYNPDFNPEVDVDGLKLDWNGHRVFCNPPYSKIGPWVRKAVTSAALTVFLLPLGREDCGWGQMLFDQKAELRWFAKRIEFIGERGTPARMRFGSMLAIVRRLHLYEVSL